MGWQENCTAGQGPSPGATGKPPAKVQPQGHGRLPSVPFTCAPLNTDGPRFSHETSTGLVRRDQLSGDRRPLRARALVGDAAVHGVWRTVRTPSNRKRPEEIFEDHKQPSTGRCDRRQIGRAIVEVLFLIELFMALCIPVKLYDYTLLSNTVVLLFISPRNVSKSFYFQIIYISLDMRSRLLYQ